MATTQEVVSALWHSGGITDSPNFDSPNISKRTYPCTGNLTIDN